MRTSHSGTVHSCICTYFHIVIDLNYSDLMYFLIYAGGVRCEAESVGSYDRSGMDGTPCSDTAAVVYLRAGIDRSIIAYRHSVAYICLRINLHPFAKACTFAYVGKSSDVAFGINFHSFRYMARLLYPYGMRLQSTGSHSKQSGKRSVRVGNADKCGTDRLLGHKILTHQHHGSSGGVDTMGVFRVCEECDGSTACFLYFAEGAHNGIRISLDAPSDILCYRFSFKFHCQNVTSATAAHVSDCKGRKKKPF